jgi:hypothetical protein
LREAIERGEIKSRSDLDDLARLDEAGWRRQAAECRIYP